MLARESSRILFYLVLITALSLYFSLRYQTPTLMVIFWVFFFFFAFTVYFFRDPERQIPSQPNAIIAPADGKIIAIKEVDDEFVGEGWQISTFMSPFNVHVNRIPFDGSIAQINYQRGKFWSAFKTQASLENEQNRIALQNGAVRLVFTQVAGAFARRIVCYLKVGDEVKKGTRFGMIIFGSRVDLIVPRQTTLKIQIGQRVRAGESIVGEIA